MSGISYTPADASGHIGTPRQGTCVSEGSGKAATLGNAAAYPVTAECKICGGWIRLDYLMQMNWRHVPADSAPAAGDAS